MTTRRFGRAALLLFATALLLTGTAAGDDGEEREILHWTCGMHPEVKEDGPGSCPICNMALVPVYREQAPVGKPAAGEILHWTCGMHPEVKEDGPGSCPICNMALVPVYREEPVGGESADEVRVSPAAARLARVRTARVERRPLSIEVRAAGEVVYDERRLAVISARFPGRIERLHADVTGLDVERGEPLAGIYSPEIVSAQREYLLARGTDLAGPAREKLRLWGVTDAQIAALDRAGEPFPDLDVHAPIGGTITHRMVAEGQYVNEGDPLFHVADLSTVWVRAAVFENDLRFVRPGMTATIAGEAIPPREGRVFFVEPRVDPTTRAASAFVEAANDDRALLPGMYAAVTVLSPLGPDGRPAGGAGREAGTRGHDARGHEDAARDARGREAAGHGDAPGVLVVPRGAIVDTGLRSVAFVEIEPGRYEAREVVAGPFSGEYRVIIEGLEEGETIVARGAFLIDSRARITGQADAVYGGALGRGDDETGRGAHGGH